MIAAPESIPVFTASMPRSVATASICAPITSTGSSWMAVTPSVFWAVTAVSALAPYTSNAADRLEVGLYARAAAGVRARDGQRDGSTRFVHTGHSSWSHAISQKRYS